MTVWVALFFHVLQFLKNAFLTKFQWWVFTVHVHIYPRTFFGLVIQIITVKFWYTPIRFAFYHVWNIKFSLPCHCNHAAFKIWFEFSLNTPSGQKASGQTLWRWRCCSTQRSRTQRPSWYLIPWHLAGLMCHLLVTLQPADFGAVQLFSVSAQTGTSVIYQQTVSQSFSIPGVENWSVIVNYNRGEITAPLREAGKMPVCRELLIIISMLFIKQRETDLNSFVVIESREQVQDLRRWITSSRSLELTM